MRLGTGSQHGRREDGQEQEALHAPRFRNRTKRIAATAAPIAAMMRTHSAVWLLLPSPSVAVVVGVVVGGGGLAPVAEPVSVTRGAGVSELSAPIQCTTSPFWYVTSDGNTSTRPAVSGILAENENFPSAPSGILPPDHVTIRPLTDCFQPAVVCATTSVTPAAIWTVSF